MADWDFDIEIRSKGGLDYEVIARSPTGEGRATMRFPFDEIALKMRLLSIENALLRSGGTRRRLDSPDEQTVEDFGRELFDALISGEVRSRYDASITEADLREESLRIKLRFDSAQLAAVPWEFLFDQRLGEYLVLATNTPLVRYIELPEVMKPLTVAPPLRMLGVIASPSDQNPLDVEREKARIEEATAEVRAAGMLYLEWLEPATADELQQRLWRQKWHIFHFAGHGGYNPNTDEGVVAFLDDAGKSKLMSATELGRLLGGHQPLRLATLNACEGARGSAHDLFSSTAATLVRRKTPAVIAMQYEISDRAAIQFGRAFYRAIADGLPVDRAVTEARKNVSFTVTNTLEWGTPVLFMRSSDGVLFKVRRPRATATAVAATADVAKPTTQPDDVAGAAEGAARLAPSGGSPPRADGTVAERPHAGPTASTEAAPVAPDGVAPTTDAELGRARDAAIAPIVATVGAVAATREETASVTHPVDLTEPELSPTARPKTVGPSTESTGPPSAPATPPTRSTAGAPPEAPLATASPLVGPTLLPESVPEARKTKRRVSPFAVTGIGAIAIVGALAGLLLLGGGSWPWQEVTTSPSTSDDTASKVVPTNSPVTSDGPRSASPSADGSSGVVVQPVTTIKLGIEIPSKSGPNSSGIIDAVRLAVSDAGRSVNGVPVTVPEELVLEDDRDLKNGLANLNTMMADPELMAVIGPYTTTVAQGQIATGNQAGLLQCSASAAGVTLTKPEAGGENMRPTGTVNFVRTVTTNDQEAAGGARFLFDRLGPVPAYLVSSDVPTAVGRADQFTTEWQALGGQVVQSQAVAPKTTDFTPVVTEAKAAGAELVYFSGDATSTGIPAALLNAMRQAGLDATFMASGEVWNVDSHQQAFANAAGSGTAAYFSYVAAADYAGRFDFETRFQEAVGRGPGLYGVTAYACTQAVLDAIKRVDVSVDRTALREAIRAATVDPSVTYSSPMGDLQFDQNGDTTLKIITIYGLDSGEWVPVGYTEVP
jgi:ABC-type branched-subunit amino acid transport system substrate-binding protein